VIVRNSRQKKFLKKNLKRPVNFLTWKAEQIEPPKTGKGSEKLMKRFRCGVERLIAHRKKKFNFSPKFSLKKFQRAERLL